MKTRSQAMEEKMLDYLDGILSEEEKLSFEKQVSENPVLLARLNTLRSLHTLLANPVLEEPSENFTHQVMTRLDHVPRSNTVRNGIFFVCSTFLVVIATALLVTAGVFDGPASVIDLNEFNLSTKYIQQYISKPLPAFQFSGKIMVQIITLLNLLLGWLLLDRAILKPLFKRRMEMNR